MEDVASTLEQKMLATYPSSIERRMGTAIADDIAEKTHDYSGSNGLDRLALEALARNSPSHDSTATAVAHYLTIRDEDNFTVGIDNVAELGVALLRLAHTHEEQDKPTPEAEKLIHSEISTLIQSADAIKEPEVTFSAPSAQNLAAAESAYKEAVTRDKGKTPASWTDQTMSAAIAIAAGASGEEIANPEFASRAKMAAARYYAENAGPTKTEFLPGIALRLTVDVKHMSDMSEIVENLDRHAAGQPVDEKWAKVVKSMTGRGNMIGHMRHDAAGQYHLLPRTDQIAIQWDLEYANNLTKSDKQRVEAQTKRVTKTWKLDSPQDKELPYILRRAHDFERQF